MAYVRKYLKGERITSVHDAVSRILAADYIMVHNKPTHPSWVGGWPVNLLRSFVRSGALHYANINPAWVAPKETEE